MTGSLPEPRAATAVRNPLLDAAAQNDAEPLAADLGAALAAGDDAVIRAALQGGPPAAVRRVWQALAAAINGGGEGIGLQLFAIPLVIVAGARTQLTLPGVLPEIDRVTALLEQHGAVGATRNFGLGNALCAAAALETLSPCALWRAVRDPAERAVADTLIPEPVAVGPGREQVHLRFLIGAGVTPQHLPSFLESASNIGTWGMPLTRELTRQLAQPGLEVLPMPRPPQPLAKAAYLGRSAQLEAALSLFLSNNLRRFRMSVGDPEAVLSAHALAAGAGELRLSLSSPFDDSMLEGFCWPLHALDDLDEVAQLFHRALADCRMNDAMVIPRVLPAVLERNMLFVAARSAAAMARAN
ncbi:MAG: hypothetical protein K2X06_06220 [Burkholderiales bacterium]|nr:hypothetical protein [Burkholderiales bacterium]